VKILVVGLSTVRLLLVLLFLMLARVSIADTGGTTLLTSVQPMSSAQGWGDLGINKSVQGNALTVDGKTYTNGLGTHANSTIIYELDSRFSRFKATVGVDDEMLSFGKSSVDFIVLGDGKTLFDSGVMRNSSKAQDLDVSVAGVSELTLEVTDAGDGIDGDHADWLNTVLTGKTTPPPIVPVGTVSGGGLTLQLSADGDVASAALGKDSPEQPVNGAARIIGCHTVGPVVSAALPRGGMSFVKTVATSQEQQAVITEQFVPSKDSIHWDVTIRTSSADWSAPICTSLRWPNPETAGVWTAWQSPDTSKSDWTDPLAIIPFTNSTWYYGQEPGGSWTGGDIFTLPIISILQSSNDTGLSLIESPEDRLINMTLSTQDDGQVNLIRFGQRFSRTKPVHLSMDLAAQSSDWRSGLAWMVRRYPDYFNPPNPRVQSMAGTAAYSGDENPVDMGRLGRMDFRTLWKLSDDYAYMGMFLPPLSSPTDQWQRVSDSLDPAGYKPQSTSFQRMNAFGKYLHSNGCYLLNYFNTTEFGESMADVTVSPEQAKSKDLWKDPSAFLKVTAPNAPLRPIVGAWQGGWAVDPGDPDYRRYLLGQIQRHLTMLPDSDGFCIDRADYLHYFNANADDGISWYNGKPTRSLVESWRELMAQLGPLVHRDNKVVFCNFMDPRLDFARQLDGVYDEYGDRPTVVNGVALVCLNKPLLTWTYDSDMSDAYFQRLLYMGAYPTAPYPLNNHCIQPSQANDQWYMDYGPLFALMKGKHWVLNDHCADIAGGAAKVNFFQVDRGWLAPIVFGGDGTTVILNVQNVPSLRKGAVCDLYYPGDPTPVRAATLWTGNKLEIIVPLHRGCALALISPAPA